MEFATAQVHKAGNQLHVTHGDDKGLFVTFYDEAIRQNFESEQQGRPVFKDVPHVHIMFPGDRTKEVKRPVKLSGDESSPSDPERWPRQWAAYQAQAAEVVDGLPVTEWAPLTKSQAMELKALHIHTVEQLAAVPDHALTWLGAREMQAKARAFLAQATDGAEVLRLKAENEALRTDLELLKQQVAELSGTKTKGGKKAAEDLT